MRTFPKVTLILGALMMVGSIIAMVAGFGSADFEGEEVFRGDAPTTWNEDFDLMPIYSVYIEDGSNVSVEVLDGDEDNRFVPCEEKNDCNEEIAHIAGFEYIGNLNVIDGNYDVNFTGEGEVIVTKFDSGGFLAAGLGMGFACCSVLIIILGLILALTMKENTPTQIVVMPGQGQVQMQQPQVQMQQPAAVVPGTTMAQPGNLIVTQQEEGPGV